MKRLMNYLGQLRVYSLVDLILLLYVAGARDRELLGLIIMHISFLAFLESQHKHSFREPVRVEMSLALYGLAITTFGKLGEQLGYTYFLFSGGYTMKKQGDWGLYSPIARGMQTLVMLVLLAPSTKFLLLASAAMVVRNAFGDWRDVEQDREEGMRTWPVVLGFKKDQLWVHFFSVLGTTWLWWYLSDLPKTVPVVLSVVEAATYWGTPRLCNKKAIEELKKAAVRLRQTFRFVRE